VDVGPRDVAVIAGELGREPRDLTGIAARCPFGYPAVSESAPVLADGAPNPTLLYLTCPTLAAGVSRIEAGGGVRALRAACREDKELNDLLAEVTRAYRERRTALLDETNTPARGEPRLTAGIGGPEGPETASCLHAYAAALLAVMSGWLTPVDAAVVERVREAWNRFLPRIQEAWCSDGRCAKWDTEQRRAAIDVGTISVRLLVADLTDGRPWSVVRKAEVTRLGEDLEPGGPLAEAARQRTAQVVARFADEARIHGAERILLAGTSAAREASDGKDFIHALGRDHDLEAMVLSEQREAALAYAGAWLDVQGDPVVLDIGGGSTELTVRLGSGRIWATSLKLGAGRCTDSWLHSDPPAPEEIAGVRGEAERLFAGVRSRFGAGVALAELSDGNEAVETAEAVEAGFAPRRLVGVAGTVTTLAALDAGLESYNADLIHLRTLSLDSVRALVARLSSLTTEERAALPSMQPGRAPVIVAGAVILMTAMETLGYRELTVSERDLLDGLVLEPISK
jgi:exopolyphosphatase / guanosine-5'-triphosphate,3'-diphosphate pyrophosphatase